MVVPQFWVIISIAAVAANAQREQAKACHSVDLLEQHRSWLDLHRQCGLGVGLLGRMVDLNGRPND